MPDVNPPAAAATPESNGRRGMLTGRQVDAFLVGYVIGEGGMGYIYDAKTNTKKLSQSAKAGHFKRYNLRALLGERIVDGFKTDDFYGVPSLEQAVSEGHTELRKKITGLREMPEEARQKAAQEMDLDINLINAQIYSMEQAEIIGRIQGIVSEIEALPITERAKVIHDKEVEKNLALEINRLGEDTLYYVLENSDSAENDFRVALKTYKVRSEVDRNVPKNADVRFDREVKLGFRHDIPGIVSSYAHLENVTVSTDTGDHNMGLLAVRYMHMPKYKEGPTIKLLKLDDVGQFRLLDPETKQVLQTYVKISKKAALDALIEALDIARNFHRRETQNGRNRLYAAKEGMIHRDLKPGNMGVEEDPFGSIELDYERPDGTRGGRLRLYVFDLGTAIAADSAITSSGNITQTQDFGGGSPYFVAANQIPPFEQTAATDVVALGRGYYAFLTYGEHPFEAEEDTNPKQVSDRVMQQILDPNFDAPFALEFDNDIPIEASDLAHLLGAMHYGPEVIVDFIDPNTKRPYPDQQNHQFWSRLYDQFDPRRWRFREGPDSEFAYLLAKRLRKRKPYTSPGLIAKDEKVRRRVEKIEKRIDALKEKVAAVRADHSVPDEQREDQIYTLERRIAVHYVSLAYTVPASTEQVPFPYEPAEDPKSGEPRDKRKYTRSYNLSRALSHYDAAVESRLRKHVEHIYQEMLDTFGQGVILRIAEFLRAGDKRHQTKEPDEGEMTYYAAAERSREAVEKLEGIVGTLGHDDQLAAKLEESLHKFRSAPALDDFAGMKETLDAAYAAVNKFFKEDEKASKHLDEAKPYLDTLAAFTNIRERVNFACKAQIARLIEIYMIQYPHWRRTRALKDMISQTGAGIFNTELAKMAGKYSLETHVMERTRLQQLLDFELYKDLLIGAYQVLPSSTRAGGTLVLPAAAAAPRRPTTSSSAMNRMEKKDDSGTEVALDVPDKVRAVVDSIFHDIKPTFYLLGRDVDNITKGNAILDGEAVEAIDEIRLTADTYFRAALPAEFEGVQPGEYQRLEGLRKGISEQGERLWRINTLCRARVRYEQLLPLNEQKKALEARLKAPERAETEFKEKQEGFVESLARFTALATGLSGAEKAQTERPLKMLEAYATSRQDAESANKALAALSFTVEGLVEQYPGVESARTAYEALKAIDPGQISKNKAALKDDAIYSSMGTLPAQVKDKIEKDAARLKSYGSGKGKADSARKALASVTGVLGGYVKSASLAYELQQALQEATELGKQAAELAGKPGQLREQAQGLQDQIDAVGIRVREQKESIKKLCESAGVTLKAVTPGQIMGPAADLFVELGYKEKARELREMYHD